MLISEIIHHFEEKAYWVNYNCTRDVLLFGDHARDVSRVGVCWVATNQVLKQAAAQHIHFIITHENCFYLEQTALPKALYNERKNKQRFCQEHEITIYRCHDAWDQFPLYGVADTLAASINIKFEPREIHSFYNIAEVDMNVETVAHHVALALKPYGAGYVEVLGDTKQRVHKIVMGVGAETSAAKMALLDGDLFICSDDGTKNWVDLQYCVDKEIPMILFHHSVNECPGLQNMANYLNKVFPSCEFVKLAEGFNFSIIQ